MNVPSILLPPPDTPWILSKSVLDEAGLAGELHLLAPGAERVPARPAAGDTLLFVIAGSITACIEPSNHILQPETTLLIRAGRRYILRNPTSAPAKILSVTLPPPRAGEHPPGLITLRG